MASWFPFFSSIQKFDQDEDFEWSKNFSDSINISDSVKAQVLLFASHSELINVSLQRELTLIHKLIYVKNNQQKTGLFWKSTRQAHRHATSINLVKFHGVCSLLAKLPVTKKQTKSSYIEYLLYKLYSILYIADSACNHLKRAYSYYMEMLGKGHFLQLSVSMQAIIARLFCLLSRLKTCSVNFYYSLYDCYSYDSLKTPSFCSRWLSICGELPDDVNSFFPESLTWSDIVASQKESTEMHLTKIHLRDLTERDISREVGSKIDDELGDSISEDDTSCTNIQVEPSLLFDPNKFPSSQATPYKEQSKSIEKKPNHKNIKPNKLPINLQPSVPHSLSQEPLSFAMDVERKGMQSPTRISKGDNSGREHKPTTEFKKPKHSTDQSNTPFDDLLGLFGKQPKKVKKRTRENTEPISSSSKSGLPVSAKSKTKTSKETIFDEMDDMFSQLLPKKKKPKFS